MKVIKLIAFLAGAVLVAQAFLTACPTCYFYDAEFVNHDEEPIGEMETPEEEIEDRDYYDRLLAEEYEEVR